MAGISPTIGSAQHPMIRRRLRLAEVRMSALDGLTLLPFPRLPATPTLAGGALRIQGVAFGPPRCLDRKILPFFIFFYPLKIPGSENRSIIGIDDLEEKRRKKFLRWNVVDYFFHFLEFKFKT